MLTTNRYFADRDIFCAGRVASDDMERVCQATGASIQSTCSDIQDRHLGSCGSFEERQIGGERFNLFSDCPGAKTCTLVLRGGAEQFIAEVERSLHDAIMIVKRALRNTTIVAGGGACEMELSSYLHRYADKNVPHKQQAVVKAFAKALEVIPRQLCDNAGFDATDILNRLRVEHRKGSTWAGVDFDHEGVRDNMEAFVWEPSLVKVNAIQAAVEAACLILSVDETISMLPVFPLILLWLGSCFANAVYFNREPRICPAPGTHPRSATGCRPARPPWPWTGYAQKVNEGKRKNHWGVKKELNIRDCDEEKQVDTRRNTFPCKTKINLSIYHMIGRLQGRKSKKKYYHLNLPWTKQLSPRIKYYCFLTCFIPVYGNSS